MQVIRAKFEVVNVQQHDAAGQATVTLEPRYDEAIPEDQRFCEATPWGKLEMFINNPVVIQALQTGQKFYLDLVPVE